MNVRSKLVPHGSKRYAIAMQLLRRGPFVNRRRAERWALARTWARYNAADLDEYLISGYQDPRINAQSILARHFLVDELFGADEFTDLKRRELEFAVRANAELHERAEARGVTIQVYLDAQRRAAVEEIESALEPEKAVMEGAWANALDDREATPVKVLELACGSANDYRFFDRYGLARFLDYTGVDLNPKNVENARTRFPEVNVEVGDVMALPYDNRSFDYVLAFDLFEPPVACRYAGGSRRGDTDRPARCRARLLQYGRHDRAHRAGPQDVPLEPTQRRTRSLGAGAGVHSCSRCPHPGVPPPGIWCDLLPQQAGVDDDRAPVTQRQW